jgi:hypothetical protein
MPLVSSLSFKASLLNAFRPVNPMSSLSRRGVFLAAAGNLGNMTDFKGMNSSLYATFDGYSTSQRRRLTNRS